METDEKACPFCGETIKSIAIKCKHCQSDLSNQPPGVTPQVTEASEPQPHVPTKSSGSLRLIGWALVTGGLGLIYYGSGGVLFAFPALWSGFALVFPGASWITRTGKGFVAMLVVMATAVAIQGGVEEVRGKRTESSDVAGLVQDVSISALLTAYEGNELKADAEYKGKMVRITGVVESVKKDVLDNPYLVIQEPGKERLLPNVQCVLNPSAFNDAKQAELGRSVTIVGKVDGLMMNVLLSDCALVEAKKRAEVLNHGAQIKSSEAPGGRHSPTTLSAPKDLPDLLGMASALLLLPNDGTTPVLSRPELFDLIPLDRWQRRSQGSWDTIVPTPDGPIRLTINGTEESVMSVDVELEALSASDPIGETFAATAEARVILCDSKPYASSGQKYWRYAPAGTSGIVAKHEWSSGSGGTTTSVHFENGSIPGIGTEASDGIWTDKCS